MPVNREKRNQCKELEKREKNIEYDKEKKKNWEII